MKRTLTLSTLSLITSAFLVGCGGSSNSDAPLDGYFIDAAVEGVDYNTTSGIHGKTTKTGKFNYNSGDKVTLSIGKLILGEVTPNEERLITPTTLSHGDEELKNLLLRTLQALDADNNTSNGISIPANLLKDINETTIKEHNESDLLTLDTTLATALDRDYDGHIDVNETEAQNHFDQSIQDWNDGKRPEENQENTNNNESNNNSDNNENQGTQNDANNASDSSQSNTSTVVLNNKQKYALAYMWNEEKLAKDIYLALNKIQPLKQLENIATRSEVKHEQMVEDLVKKYDINITNLDTYEIKYTESELRALPAGKFGVDTIQALYNTLYDKGIKSKQDALEVGCMVEVTDVDDLNKYIDVAKEVQATDLIETFDKLRSGSYSHYWAFDKGLQSEGISTGCCSLGTIDGVNYCHPEYPQNENENGNDSGSDNGSGNGNRNGSGNH